jgi:magnesium and cobalt transporter
MMMKDGKSWFTKITDAIMREPQDKDELIESLRDAYTRELMDKDSLTMIEGVLAISQMQVRDIMIPKAQATMITEKDKLKDIVTMTIASGHSRFPVTNEKRDEVIGILLAKELLPFTIGIKKNFEINDLLRPVLFIPESKRLDILLKEFKQNKNHMAIVADEHGGIAGLITLEDILEQIVGQISDELDPEDKKNHITEIEDGKYLVQAQTTVAEINDYFQVNLDSEEMDTIGGLVLKEKGYMPSIGEVVKIPPFSIIVTHADQRKLHLLELSIKK